MSRTYRLDEIQDFLNAVIGMVNGLIQDIGNLESHARVLEETRTQPDIQNSAVMPRMRAIIDKIDNISNAIALEPWHYAIRFWQTPLVKTDVMGVWELDESEDRPKIGRTGSDRPPPFLASYINATPQFDVNGDLEDTLGSPGTAPLFWPGDFIEIQGTGTKLDSGIGPGQRFYTVHAVDLNGEYILISEVPDAPLVDMIEVRSMTLRLHGRDFGPDGVREDAY